MRKILVLIVATVIVLWLSKADALSLFDCNNANTAYRTICSKHELRKFGREIDDQLSRLLQSADPLTSLLLKRDQRYFEDILSADDGNFSGVPSEYDENYVRILAALKGRRNTLSQLRVRGAVTLEGNWSNVFANIAITKAEGGALAVTIDSQVSYDVGEINCSVSASATLGKDGWYSAAVGDKDYKGQMDIIRLRLHGRTLRVVHEVNRATGVCDGKAHNSNLDGSGSAYVLTGSYFRVGSITIASSVNAPSVAPSFNCANAENADEEEICADPEMAQADRQIARLYHDAILSINHTLAGFLRVDQRLWASDNSKDFLFNLHPLSDKALSTVHHTSAARELLLLRQRQRILLLRNLDEKRSGIEGLWMGYNAALTIVPANGKTDGTIRADGSKWDVEDYKSYCDFASDGRIENGVFNPVNDFPTLKRDGGTLLVAAEDPDKYDDFFYNNGQEKKPRPSYCRRMRSPKARLLPVKANSGIEAIGKRIAR